MILEPPSHGSQAWSCVSFGNYCVRSPSLPFLGLLLSHKKEQKFESVLVWLPVTTEPVTQNEVRKRKTNIIY